VFCAHSFQNIKNLDLQKVQDLPKFANLRDLSGIPDCISCGLLSDISEVFTESTEGSLPESSTESSSEVRARNGLTLSKVSDYSHPVKALPIPVKIPKKINLPNLPVFKELPDVSDISENLSSSNSSDATAKRDTFVFTLKSLPYPPTLSLRLWAIWSSFYLCKTFLPSKKNVLHRLCRFYYKTVLTDSSSRSYLQTLLIVNIYLR
jgi:hypothetical protein